MAMDPAEKLSVGALALCGVFSAWAIWTARQFLRAPSAKPATAAAAAPDEESVRAAIAAAKEHKQDLIDRATARRRAGDMRGNEFGHIGDKGEAVIKDAMRLPVLGAVDFRWGFFNYKSGKGNGIAKIMGAMELKNRFYEDKKYNAGILMKVPEILMRGKREIRQGRIAFRHASRVAVLDKDKKGRWVFNAYPGKFPEVMPFGTTTVARKIKQGKTARSLLNK
jgi:hypothetical protein